MTHTLRIFMDGLIDYAGLFPPARLDMPEAVATFVRHLESDYSWMLGCFICPASRLGEFAAHRRQLERHAPIRVSVIGTLATGGADLKDVASKDAAMVLELEHEGWAQGAMLEVRWSGRSRLGIEAYAGMLANQGCAFERIFFEIERSDSWESDVKQMATLLSDSEGRFGFKIRTGGLAADDYPTPEEVAVVIAACRDAGTPMKATAGLHHPIRHDSREGVTQHGFLNVFCAGVFANALGLDSAELSTIVHSRDLDEFVFAPNLFSWRDHAVNSNAIRAARSSLAHSFGSCSFDEPLEDLASAGLL